jgi:CHAD domain-containing protein
MQLTRFTKNASDLLPSLQQQLPKPWHMHYEPSVPQAAAVLDTYDDELWQQGRVLLSTDKHLLLLGDSARISCRKTRKTPGFKQDIVDAAMRKGLAGVSELRCLLPQPGFAARYFSASVLDDADKTCARLWVLELQSDTGGLSYLELTPLRGYRKIFKLLSALLLDLGAQADVPPTAMLEQLGYRTHNYSSTPDIDIEPTITARTASRRIIATYLAVARQNEDGIIHDLDTEFLHDYRVSLRRVRSLLSLFKGVWENDAQRQIRQRFSALMRITNRLRDLDVYVLDQDSYYELLPEPLHPGLDQIFAAFRRERTQQWRKLAAHLQSPHYQQEIAVLQTLFQTEDAIAPGVNADVLALDYARELIGKHYRRVCKIARKIDADTPDSEVHELRIQCKKLRYLLDFFTPILDKKIVRKLIKSLKILQDNLGRFNDYSSQQLSLQAFLDQQLQRSKTTSATMIESIGALIAIKHQLQLQERALVMQSFNHFHSAQTEHLFQVLNSGSPGETASA